MARSGPASADAWIARGQALLAANDLYGALDSFSRATKLEPDVALHWARYAKVHAALRRHDDAEAGFRRACDLAPAVPAFHVLLASALREQNRAQEALAVCKRTMVRGCTDLHVAITWALTIPPVYLSLNDLHFWRARYERGLHWLIERLPQWRVRADQVLDLEWHNFYLAYQGENDRELQSKYSDFLAALLVIAVPHLQRDIMPSPPRHDGKLAIGFVSSFFRASTVGDYFLHWLTDLPRDLFHVSAFYLGHVIDNRTADFRRGSDYFEQLHGSVTHVATAIRERRLDAVIYPEVGMAPLLALLSNLRLAPRQLAAWGHPVTTGSRFVEHYISCAMMELDEAPSHYREQLVRLPGIGVRYEPARGTRHAARERYGLPPDKHVYLCPHALQKIHPAADALFLDILARDSEAVLVFFRAMTQGQTQTLVQRLAAGMRERALPLRNQVKFLPLLPRPQFLDVMTVADVMLDTPYWSGGNTTLDALAVGLPVVSFPGSQMRSRQTAAMLRIIGLDELIAHDREDYVRIALRITNDRSVRDGFSQRIREGTRKLFNRHEPISALSTALQAVCRRTD